MIDEVANFVSTIRAVSAFIGWRLIFTTDTLAPFSRWSNRTSDETTAAIWADVFEHCVDTVGAEGAFVAADPGRCGIHW
ncbi:hypothetical protein N9164_16485 [Draconibacterium sp.]|nr:hypothetical protein [Draconibacterium sp.]